MESQHSGIWALTISIRNACSSKATIPQHSKALVIMQQNTKILFEFINVMHASYSATPLIAYNTTTI